MGSGTDYDTQRVTLIKNPSGAGIWRRAALVTDNVPYLMTYLLFLEKDGVRCYIRPSTTCVSLFREGHWQKMIQPSPYRSVLLLFQEQGGCVRFTKVYQTKDVHSALNTTGRVFWQYGTRKDRKKQQLLNSSFPGHANSLEDVLNDTVHGGVSTKFHPYHFTYRFPTHVSVISHLSFP